MMEQTVCIFDIVRNSYVDGPGIRTTVFFKGCNLHCAWCHNPESQKCEPEMLWYREDCDGCGKCKSVCPYPDACRLCGNCEVYCPGEARKICGKWESVAEIGAVLLRDRDYYQSSGGGVTFSGGECMMQPDGLSELLKFCRENRIETAVDTAGNFPFEAFERILPDTDLFLYDVKTTDPELHKRYMGVGNERILGNLSRLLERGARVWVRMPIIPGVNDRKSEMEALGRFLREHGSPERVELLPYHRMGERKYKGLGREVPQFETPTAGRMEELRTDLRDILGARIEIG